MLQLLSDKALRHGNQMEVLYYHHPYLLKSNTTNCQREIINKYFFYFTVLFKSFLHGLEIVIIDLEDRISPEEA